MARQFNINGQRYSEGVIYRNFSGRDFSDIFKFSGNRILQYGLSDSKMESGLLVFEGNFASGSSGEISGSLNRLAVFHFTLDGAGQTVAQVWISQYPKGTNLGNYASTPGSVSGGQQIVQSVASTISQYTGYSDALKSFLAWESQPASIDVGALASSVSSPAQSSTQATKNLLTTLSAAYDESNAPDPITNFDPKTQKIRIDGDAFGANDYDISFKIAKSQKALKKLQTSDYNLLYNRKNGYLYYNVNLEDSGYGDRGGLIAALSPRLPLSTGNFEF